MKLIEVVTDSGDKDLIVDIAHTHGLRCWVVSPGGEGEQAVVRILATADQRQKVEDNLHSVLEVRDDAYAVVMPVDTIVPPMEKKPADGQEDKEGAQSKAVQLTRAELYQNIEAGARLDGNFLLLVALSTIVAAIGLMEDNVAIVIGAMVIAPLLGPNIALALGTTLGDKELIIKALKSNGAGSALALLMSVVIGLVWPLDLDSHELMSRTDVGLDSAVLALASGAAAVLSLTAGASSVLVGVMVAVALLPPLATVGLMLAAGQPTLAVGAALLLAINVVCVNLSAKIVFLAKGVKPRTWYEQQAVKQSMALHVGLWVLSLLLLLAAIALRAWLLPV